MINFRSKKGVTLTELIIVCSVMAVIIAATSTVLIIGGRIFKQGSDTTNAMAQTDVVEKWLQNSLSVAKNAMLISDISAARPENTVSFFFDDAEILHITTRGPETDSPEQFTDLDNIRQISISFSSDVPPTALSRMTASYTIDTKTGRSISGSIVMNNRKGPFESPMPNPIILKHSTADPQTSLGITLIKPTP